MFAAGSVEAGDGKSAIRFGVRAGVDVNASGLRDEASPGQITFNFRNDLGYHLGLAFRINLLGETLHLQPEMLYHFNSYRMSAQPLDATYGTLKAHTTLINVPLLLGVKLGPVHAHGGPVFNIYHNPRIVDGNGNSVNNITSEYPTVGCMLGAGLSIWKLNLDVRFNTHFTEPRHRFEIAGHDVPAVRLDKNNVMISLGLLF
jgi:hypothetical protein